MKKINKSAQYTALLFLLCIVLFSCQKMDRPQLSDYPKDVTAPGGPLKFYAAFDGTSSNTLLNAVDSVRANFASINPLASITGISGKAINGADQKAVKYNSANDFGKNASSFSISMWLKNTVPGGGNPQYVFSLAHKDIWFNSALFFYIDHAGAGSTVANAQGWFHIMQSDGSEVWFDFTGANSIPGLLDNNWHHIVFTYDEANSSFKTYKDGTLLNTQAWTGHGPMVLDNSKISGLVIGGMNKHVGIDGWTDAWIQSWQGGLDQFRLYGKKVLTASEVLALFNSKL
jgi:Concanavalin A-like lectin/glucanases superfamily